MASRENPAGRFRSTNGRKARVNVPKLRQAAEKIYDSLAGQLYGNPGSLPSAPSRYNVGVILLSLIAVSRFYRAKRIPDSTIKTRAYLAVCGHPIHRRHIHARVANQIRDDPSKPHPAEESLVSLIASEICSDVSLLAAAGGV